MKTTLRFITVASLIFLTTACASRSKKAQNTEPPPFKESQAEASEPPQTAVAPDAKAAANLKTEELLKPEDVPMNTTNTEYVGDNVATATGEEDASAAATSSKALQAATGKKAAAKPVAAAKSSAKKAKTIGVEPEKAMLWLEHGNTRFVKRQLRADGQSAKDRLRLLKGQNPHSTVFACSDSRMPPELVFDQKLGEIYVIRTAGLGLDSAVIASLEDAADRVGTQLLVVLANEDCGDANKTVDQIVTRSASLAERVNTGAIKLVPATYDLKTGVVKFQ